MDLKLALGSEHLLAKHRGIESCTCNSRWARDFLLATALGSEHSLASHMLFGICTNSEWHMHLQLTLESKHSQLTLGSEYSPATYIGAEKQRETLTDSGSHEQQGLLQSPTSLCNRSHTEEYDASFFFSMVTHRSMVKGKMLTQIDRSRA